MSITLKQNRILSLSLNFESDFPGGDVLGESSVSLSPIVSESDLNSVHVFVTITFTCQSLNTDFNLNSELVIPFYLTPKQKIKKLDLFKCVELAKKHLQDIITVVFAGQNSLIVAPIEYGEISDKLDEHINNLQ